MTREIKFRGKCLESCTWVYGSLFNSIWRKSSDGSRVCYIFPDNMLDDDDGGGYSWEDFAEAAEDFEVDPVTVGQYTGLKDKNGKEIYEDEILTDCYGSIGVVEWENGRFVVNFGACDVFEIGECFNEPYEVWSIGNIHDNPELLKSE